MQLFIFLTSASRYTSRDFHSKSGMGRVSPPRSLGVRKYWRGSFALISKLRALLVKQYFWILRHGKIKVVRNDVLAI